MLDGDEPEACIIREAMEETGVAIANRASRLRRFRQSRRAPPRRSLASSRPMAQADRIGAGGGVDDDEHIEIVEPPLDDALAMIERGEICDAKTIALLYYAKASGLMSREAD